jgi:tetratricopeptide (TPR) repeat protein
MLRSFSFKNLSTRNLASALALGVASMGGVAGTAILTATPAIAQEYSDNFVEVYQPVSEVVNAEGGDVASVKGQLPGVVAAATTPDDKYAAGGLLLNAGTKAQDTQLQRQGLELMLASGMTPPEQVGQFNWFVGNLAFEAKDFAAAREALMAAQAAGHSGPDVDIPGLIAESYFAEDNDQAGVEYVMQAAQERSAAGQAVPENWLLRALQSSYELNMAPQAMEISKMLVSSYPTERNWLNSLQVINELNEFDPQQQLDLLRLMRETNALSNRNEFVRYIEAADPRIMSNEVDDVLAAGLAAGEFQADETYYTEVKSIVDQRAAADRSEAPGLVAEAQGSSDAMVAIEAADVSYSLDDFAQAEAMYQMALDKGATDRDMVLTRLGMAQAKQGKFAEAQATLEQVSGARAPIAEMWALYAQTQQAG